LFNKYLSVSTRNKIKAHLPNQLFQKKTFSQCGEDVIISYVLSLIFGEKKIKYLDIGANHPFQLSNTALLYKKGGNGILIEPDPFFFKLLKKNRPRDTVLDCGIHFSGESISDFYIMETPTLNTFSRNEMERYVGLGHKLTATLPVNLKDINSVLEIAENPDFMSLDIEGLDKEVLEMINWQKYRPTCICVETLTYDTYHEPKKVQGIIDFMLSKNYFVYADTFINTIFVDCEQWRTHWTK